MRDDPLRYDSAPWTAGTALAIVIPCFLLTVVLGLLSDGVYHDDDLTHFLMARWARWCPEYLLHMWGRPGLTIPLASVAWIGSAAIGWHLARLLSAIVTAVTALLAARLATRLGVRSTWLVVLACYVQPLNTVLGATTLTENFTAFYLVAAVGLLEAGWAAPGSLVFSMALLTRHEAVVFLPIWCVAVLLRQAPAKRKILALFAAVSGPVAYNLSFRLILEDWPVRVMFQPQGSSQYLPTNLLAYVPHALEAVPPALAGLAVVGAIVLLRQGRALVPAITGVYLVTHVAVKAIGVYASGGYARFMVAVAPFVAILAVAGLQEMVRQVRRRLPVRWGWIVLGAVWVIGLAGLEIERRAGRIELYSCGLVWVLRGAAAAVVVFTLLSAAMIGRGGWLRRTAVALLAIACAIQWAVLVRPMHLRAEQRQIQDVVVWLREQGLDERPLFTTHPWAPYFLDLVELPRAHKGPRLLASMPV
ncbi:MAG TPA: hypothetical protein VMV94_06625, partial [Phycisphaerae bacterium]|nr:hypothetical protein [Phycisphaerae bacterium]